MRPRVTGIAILTAVALAGCGGASGGAGNAGTSVVPPTTTGPGGAPTGIATSATLAVGGTNKKYVTATGPLIAIKGYFKTRLAAADNAANWVHTQSLTGSFAQKETMLLNRDAFKIGVAEDLYDKTAHISTAALKFAAFVGPTDSVSLERSSLSSQQGAKSFSVSGVPGAIGYLVGGKTEIAFASGYYYIHLSRNSTTKAAVQELTGVASTLFKQLG